MGWEPDGNQSRRKGMSFFQNVTNVLLLRYTVLAAAWSASVYSGSFLMHVYFCTAAFKQHHPLRKTTFEMHSHMAYRIMLRLIQKWIPQRKSLWMYKRVIWTVLYCSKEVLRQKQVLLQHSICLLKASDTFMACKWQEKNPIGLIVC